MERRNDSNRRHQRLVDVPLSRKRDRRDEERRNSPRKEVAFDVREPKKKARSCQGDVSVEGASYITTAPPLGDVVQLMLTIPTYAGPMVAQGRVVARKGVPNGTQISITFTDIDIEAQLALASWIELPFIGTAELDF
jgi:PilZ domain